MHRTPPILAAVLILAAACLWLSPRAAAQANDPAWLRYAPLRQPLSVPTRVVALGLDPVVQNAAAELERGLLSLSGRTVPDAGADAIVLGTVQQFHSRNRNVALPALQPGEFLISWHTAGSSRRLRIVGGSPRGVLYGVFALLRKLSQGTDMSHASLRQRPAMPIRWVDQWDNADGTIERGYAGRSLFFEGGHVRKNLAPVAAYARLLASVGVNAVNVNNVNNAAQFLQPEMLHELVRVADSMRPWGVHLALSVDVASPKIIGGLATYDPLDPAVKAWWNAKADAIYTLIPDFAGFTVKADSEGQPGPASYGRTPADAANTLAAALAPHHGIVLYRAFVYNHHLNWRDPRADRARAAYDIFHPLDGKFLPNVVIQTKEGPIDFQAQEPVSPLFGGLTRTNQAMEIEVTQEYTGQQRHLVYLAPMWQWVLDFDLRVRGAHTPVGKILARQRLGGLVAVAGVGRDHWLNSPLAMANLYAFGRFAWDPNLTAEQIAVEWTRQTVSRNPGVVAVVSKMLLESWPAYVDYTGPLGMQTLTDITGSHYGPNIESSERNGWGQWHKADPLGVGFDRTVATGTGFVGQYPPAVANVYESTATTPDNLLLFFHHVPYTYKLHNGLTVIQYIYSSHYRGAATAASFVNDWISLKGRIPGSLYSNMLPRLEYQAGHSIVWRDAIVQYFFKLSGIPDKTGRAGHFPGRYEAEDAKLADYQVFDVNPWEDASRGKAVTCSRASLDAAPKGSVTGHDFSRADDTSNEASALKGHGLSRADDTAKRNGASAPEETRACAATWTYAGREGRYNIAVQYFDLNAGVAHFTLSHNGRPLVSWAANNDLPSQRPDGDNSTRYTAHQVELKPGDTITVQGVPDGHDPAALDYIQLLPATPQPQ
ncbi:MAG TPA: alpha-glucuronidase family glycosyl hydrolase [Terracidiphilus sp.]|nr:alpha-glucuronidase family glycosyl hydrolase [Terracidiphilus sp.]